ncbi:unnamed protein product [Sphagnum balticum]
MLSTPAPIPISITPALILAAMMEQASNPEEQSRLTATMVVVSGNPARNWAILLGIYPAPDCRLFPTAISWTSLGLTLALMAASLRTTERRYSGAVSLSGPFFPLVMGVLTAEQMTTSSSDLTDMQCF